MSKHTPWIDAAGARSHNQISRISARRRKKPRAQHAYAQFDVMTMHTHTHSPPVLWRRTARFAWVCVSLMGSVSVMCAREWLVGSVPCMCFIADTRDKATRVRRETRGTFSKGVCVCVWWTARRPRNTPTPREQSRDWPANMCKCKWSHGSCACCWTRRAGCARCLCVCVCVCVFNGDWSATVLCACVRSIRRHTIITDYAMVSLYICTAPCVVIWWLLSISSCISMLIIMICIYAHYKAYTNVNFIW